MRLTLRTMLAYIDSVLDPADAEVLGNKIESSDFARDLVQRIRTVLKKVRMDAPKLDSKRFEDDPNSVSDYLDSALPQDRVSEFERACIESDRHLAEVASCHQVLTMVLGKPADVPQELRDKIYALGDGKGTAVKPPPVPSGLARPTAGAPPVVAGNGQPGVEVEPELPEYLREGRGASLLSILAIAGGVILVAIVGLWAAGAFNRGTPVVADAANVRPSVPTPPAVPPTDAQAAPTDNPAPPNSPVEPPPTEPVPAEPLPAVPAPIESIDPPDAPLVAKPAEPLTSEPIPKPGEPLQPVDVPARVSPMPKPPMAEGGLDVGLHVSDSQVLARWVEDPGVWARVSPRDVLSVGDRLLSLPTFRPQLGLASGVQVMLAGESSVRLEPQVEPGKSPLAIDYGRLLLVTGGVPGSELELAVGELRGVVTLVDADSELAVQVKRYLPPGSDPEKTEALLVVELFNSKGRVNWEAEGQPRVEVPALHVYAYVGSEPPEAQGPYAKPDWIDPRKSLSDIDRETSPILEELLAMEKPLNLSLLERMQDRRANVRALAARCMGFLDQYESLLKELNDPKQSVYWNGEFVALRHAMCRSPQSALTLKDTLERQRPDYAKDLYRLLMGYSPEQLEKSGAQELVKFLEHEEMDVRVLAFQNLYTITSAMEFYMPQKQPQDQRAAIQGWKSRLEKGTIVYKSPPSALDSYKPVGRPLGAIEAAPRGTGGR